MATRLYIGDSGKQVPVVGVPVAKELGGLTIDNFIGAVDESGKLLAPTQITNVKWEGIKDVGDYAAWYLLQNNASLQTLDLSCLEHISGSYACSYMCYHCDNLREINLDNLKTITGNYACEYMFNRCWGLDSVTFPSLTDISGEYACAFMFEYHPHDLTSVSFPSLKTITGMFTCYLMFSECYILENINLPELTTISGDQVCSSMFNGANLQSISFPQLTTIEGYAPFGYETWEYIFANCYNLTEIHFRSDIRSIVEALPGYDSKWGATSATVYFDL